MVLKLKERVSKKMNTIISAVTATGLVICNLVASAAPDGAAMGTVDMFVDFKRSAIMR